MGLRVLTGMYVVVEMVNKIYLAKMIRFLDSV
jgi:hypothetical protein